MSSTLTAAEAAGHCARGVDLFERGRVQESIECFREAIRLDPDVATAHYNLGNALAADGRLLEACAAFRGAVTAAPDLEPAYRNLGLVLLELDDLEEALPVLERAVALDTESVDATSSLALARVRRGDLRVALQLLERNLASAPGRTRDLALKAVVLDRLGEREQVQPLLDYERLIVSSRPAAPAGFAGIDAFNEALAAYVLAHPSLEESPIRHATRGGRHSGNLLLDSHPLTEALESLIEAEVERYAACGREPGAHPFVADSPDSVTLTAWAIVLERGGCQIPHIHSASWVSGVYYVRVPTLPVDGTHAGWIEFGSPDRALTGGHELPTHRVEPVEGGMVIFPSYIYHRTVPFDAPALRISLAFDCERAPPE
jgi:uncharacterized protein (TIGR02466 family)